MRRCLADWLAIVGLCLAWPGLAGASDATLVSLETPRGVTQPFILIRPDKAISAAVILFAGGNGALGLTSATTMSWGAGNFLVRTREHFAAEGLLVAVVDAPSDYRDGMTATFRMSRDHASDIRAVVAHLKAIAKVPVWLVGTSMGTLSAAGAAVHAGGADGLVLTSTITRSKPGWSIARTHPDGVASMALGTIRLPVLVMSHAKDGCDITSASDTSKLKARLTNAKPTKVVLLDGGRQPKSDPCEAFAQHGYFGIEDKAVSEIVAFVKSSGS